MISDEVLMWAAAVTIAGQFLVILLLAVSVGRLTTRFDDVIRTVALGRREREEGAWRT